MHLGLIAQLGLYIKNRHENKEHFRGLWFQRIFAIGEGYPLTVRVTPQHHSSTTEFELSYVDDGYDAIDNPVFKSFSVQERLALKQQF